MTDKPIVYQNELTRHLILYAKGHYKRTRYLLDDMRRLMSNYSGVAKTIYTDWRVFTFVGDSFVDSCTKGDYKTLLKCFYSKPWGLGGGAATVEELVSHMIGMMGCIQVFDGDTMLVSLGEPNPNYLPVPKSNERSSEKAV